MIANKKHLSIQGIFKLQDLLMGMNSTRNNDTPL